MIELKHINKYGMITTQDITDIDDQTIAYAKSEFKKAQAKGVCFSEYDDLVWVMTNERDKFYFSFSFMNNQLFECLKDKDSYNSFILKLKTFVILRLGFCSLEFLREFISFTIKQTCLSNVYTEMDTNSLGTSSSLMNHYVEFIRLIKPDAKTYIERVEQIRLVNDQKKAESKKDRDHPCMLAEFQSYFLFDDLIRDWWDNAPDSERHYYAPLYAFWILTTILPLRVMEFCVMPFDCIKRKSDKFFITVRRSNLKGNHTELEKKYHHNLTGDYSLYDYQVTEEIYRLFEKIRTISSNYHRNYNLLFSLDQMYYYNQSPRKKPYNEESIFDDEALNKLLDDFYSNILVSKHGLSVVSEDDLRKRYIGMDDDTFSISSKEIMNIQLKHTRHLSMINLVYNGCNPLIIKEFAAHADESTSANYYGNLSKTARCITKILYDKSKHKKLRKQILSSQERTPMSLFINESGQYTEMDDGRCFSHAKLNNQADDCAKCGFTCHSCDYFIPDKKDSYCSDEDEIDEEMRLIAAIIRRDDIDQKLTEYQMRYHSLQQKLGKYIENIRRETNGTQV